MREVMKKETRATAAKRRGRVPRSLQPQPTVPVTVIAADSTITAPNRSKVTTHKASTSARRRRKIDGSKTSGGNRLVEIETAMSWLSGDVARLIEGKNRPSP